jgi:ATP-binding cassette subfamily F protein 3
LDQSGLKITKIGNNMMNISARKIRIAYQATTVLDGVDVVLNDGDRVVLVGENGSGKSTLLKIMSGVIEPDDGTVTVEQYQQVVYVAQDFSGEISSNGYTFLGTDKVLRRALKMLNELNFPVSLLELETGLLSGGQRKILEVVRGFASGARFIFLDEPENHLDYFGREWLIGTIEEFRGGVLLVSHDQYLIDSVANKIIELEDCKLMSFTGDYQFYLDQRMRQLEGKHELWAQNEKEIQRHKEMVAQLRQKVMKIRKLAGTYQNKKRKLEELMKNQIDRPQLERKSITIKVGDVDRKGGKRIVSIRDLALEFDNRRIFKGVNLQLMFGEKVCLFGRNGSGKTSLVKLMREELIPTEGEVKLGVNLSIGYFAQNHVEDLDLLKTPLDELQAATRESDFQTRVRLSKFLIDSTSVAKKIQELSGGQKTRLRFAKLFSHQTDFLVLDEPTNHLDRLSWQVLVQAIRDFQGTVLLISHDRKFIDETVTKLWVIDNASIREFHGNLSQFIEQ